MEITSLIEEPTVNQDIFSNDLYKNATLYVPKEQWRNTKPAQGGKTLYI